MQSPTLKTVAGAMSFLALASRLLLANETNPYGSIVDRNPFGLKPPPPPPPTPEQTAPPVPMAKVVLTGLLSTFGEPRALFEIVEDPGKGGGTAKKPILREGERLGPVEVLAIDVVKNSVRIRNSGVETNVTFEVAKSGPTAGGPGVPGVAPALTAPPAMSSHMQMSPGPTVISPNSALAGGGGVTLIGGGSSANPAAGNPVNTASVPGALGGNYGGSPGIPPRPLRTDGAEGMPAMTRDQAALLREVRNLEGKGPPLPPSHLSGEIQQALHGDQPQAPGQFPQFPTKPAPRPPGR